MAVAATLLEAAALSLENLYPLWVADTLSDAMASFADAIGSDFPDSDANNQPIGNWLAIIAAYAPTISDFENGGTGVGQSSLPGYQQSVDYVYRFCKFASAYRDLGLISAPQAAAILAAYNAEFA